MQNLFNQVLTQFKSASQYQRFISRCERDYDIRIYRLSTYSLDQASNIYLKAQHKYNSKVFTENACGWYENERRLYVWFILCFMKLKSLDAMQFVDSYPRYWTEISPIFWGKTVPFLKYQFLSLIKAKGRITWKDDEDQLLCEVFKAHQKGEWNQIAKHFYFDSNGKYFKSAKQCRERWENHLNTAIRKDEWSNQEDRIMLEYVLKYGKKWAKISEALGKKRTEHMVKNRFRSVTSKHLNINLSEKQLISHILKTTFGQHPAKKRTQPIKEEFDFVESYQIQPVQQQPKQSRNINKKKDKKGSANFEHQLSFNNMSVWKDIVEQADHYHQERNSNVKKNSIIQNSRNGRLTSQNFFENSIKQGHTIPSFPINHFENRSLLSFHIEEKLPFFENDSLRSHRSGFRLNQSFVSLLSKSQFDTSFHR